MAGLDVSEYAALAMMHKVEVNHAIISTQTKKPR